MPSKSKTSNRAAPTKAKPAGAVKVKKQPVATRSAPARHLTSARKAAPSARKPLQPKTAAPVKRPVAASAKKPLQSKIVAQTRKPAIAQTRKPFVANVKRPVAAPAKKPVATKAAVPAKAKTAAKAAHAAPVTPVTPKPPKPAKILRNIKLKPLAWGLLPSDWRDICAEMGEPTFRSRQIWKWLQQRRVMSWDAMSDIPEPVRKTLADRFDISAWTDDTYEQSADDGVRKLLLGCRDGERIESVIIPARDQATACISTQAGCAFKCAFCATGKCGFDRNLEAGEIVGQFIAASTVSPRRLTHVVFMGMGEPFANYDNVLKAIRILNDFDGLAVGARRITISTCGVVPGIERLIAENIQVELSVSLHAPDDALRTKLMPVNKQWPLPVLMEACRNYTEKTGRIITFEYTLVEGLNDQPEHADKIIELVRPIRGRVNLIPLSPVKHFRGVAPSPEACIAFGRRLLRGGLNVTLRRSKGRSVTAACGQLRLSRVAAVEAASIPRPTLDR